MLDELYKLSRRLINSGNRPYQRYFIQQNPIQHRCVLLLGQRGIGKTTTLIQYLLAHSKQNAKDPRILYVPVDHVLVTPHTLYDIASAFSQNGGEVIAFDEVHQSANWAQMIKSIYDTYPELTILASGSRAISIAKQSYDLSRRAIVYQLAGLSLREFIELKTGETINPVNLDEIINNHEDIADRLAQRLTKIKLKILPLFKEYLNVGFYPYFLDIKNKFEFWLTINQNMRASIESDLPAVYPKLTGTTVKKLQQLLAFIAESVPFTPNWTRIKQIIDISDDRTIKNYFDYLQQASLIQHIGAYSSKLKKLTAPEKIYLDNPNQIQAASNGDGNIGNMRETFFINMLSMRHQIALPAKGDFIIDGDTTFEIGGNNKSFKQINGVTNSYLACDEMESGIGKKIPLWLFGLLY